MSTVWFDLRTAARLLRRRPGLTAAAVVSLGLGIGANVGIFSLVNTVLLKPLPFPDSHEIVGVYRIDPEITGPNPSAEMLGNLWAVPYEVHRDWVEMSPVFSSAGAYAPAGFGLLTDDGTTFLRGTRMTSGAMGALGVPATLGRVFLPEDDEVGAPLVAVLSYGLWQGQFGGAPEVLGTQLPLDEGSFTVVGIMPQEFAFPDHNNQIWVSFSDERKTSPVRNAGYLKVLARLKTGVSLGQAQREMNAVAVRIGELHPEEREHGIGVFSQKELTLAGSGSGLLFLMGAVSLVLLIACTNIASLFLIRATERQREIGIRRALGAGQRRLVFQHLSESLILSGIGGIVGTVLVWVGLEPALSLMPSELPRIGEMTVDLGILGLSAGFALVAGLVTGALPALRVAATPIGGALQESGRSLAGGRGRNRTQMLLVVAQVAVAFVLLSGAGLCIRSMMTLLSVEPGFEAEELVAVRMDVPQNRRGSWEDTEAFYQEVGARLSGIPGVDAVGAVSQMPFIGGWSSPPVSIETAEGIWDGISHFTTVLPSHFETMGIPLVSGRLLTSDDRSGSQPVIVVSQALATRAWPEEDPLGRRIRLDVRGDSIWRTVVGVVGDVRYRLDFDPQPMFYVPFSQRPAPLGNWLLRTSGDPGSVAAAAIREARSMNASGTPSVRMLDEAIGDSYAVASARFVVILLASLALMAGTLAILGVYAVLAYLVQLRAREIGIQIALGAERREVLGTVLRRGGWLAGAGILIGVLGSLGLARLIESLLFGIQPWDPQTHVLVAAMVLLAVLVASFVPARRAADLDPVEVLKGD